MSPCSMLSPVVFAGYVSLLSHPDSKGDSELGVEPSSLSPSLESSAVKIVVLWIENLLFTHPLCILFSPSFSFYQRPLFVVFWLWFSNHFNICLITSMNLNLKMLFSIVWIGALQHKKKNSEMTLHSVLITVAVFIFLNKAL